MNSKQRKQAHKRLTRKFPLGTEVERKHKGKRGVGPDDEFFTWMDSERHYVIGYPDHQKLKIAHVSFDGSSYDFYHNASLVDLVPVNRRQTTQSP